MRKLLNADELARYANVHKSTVLLAIRRGELRASPTEGRSSGIRIDDARDYLRSREVPIPQELLTDEAVSRVGVLTESLEILSLMRRALPPNTELVGGSDLKASLVLFGTQAMASVVLDLDVTFMNPIAVIRSLRASEHYKPTRIAVLGLRDESFSAARAAGADATFLKVHQKPLTEWLAKVVSGE